MPKVGPCKTLFLDSGKFCLWSMENGDFGSIRNYFKSFELSPIFHSHRSRRYYNNQQQTNKALLVKNLLTACCNIGQSLPDLADVHRQIHFSSAETQLPKKTCWNTEERLNFSKPRNAVDLNKSDGGGWLALAQRGRGDPCHYHVLSVLTQILTFFSSCRSSPCVRRACSTWRATP